jgi:hypothetical protein
MLTFGSRYGYGKLGLDYYGRTISSIIPNFGTPAGWEVKDFISATENNEKLLLLDSESPAYASQTNIPALPGETYTASFYARGSIGLAYLRLKVEAYGKLELLETYTQTMPVLDSHWQRCKLTFAAHPSTTTLKFIIEAQSTGLLVIKSCKLEQESHTTPYINDDNTIARSLPIGTSWIGDYEVTGYDLADNAVTAEKFAAGVFDGSLSFFTGVVYDGEVIPEPEGFPKELCIRVPFVSLRERWEGWGYKESNSTTDIKVDPDTWQVTCRTGSRQGYVTYLLLCLKD